MASLYTKEKLKSVLVNHNIDIPKDANKSVLKVLYREHVESQERGEFSSDDEMITRTPTKRNKDKKKTGLAKKPPKEEKELDVALLSDEELRDQLKQHGVNPGPIIESTRKVYEKKLQRLLEQKVHSEVAKSTPPPPAPPAPRRVLPTFEESDFSDQDAMIAVRQVIVKPSEASISKTRKTIVKTSEGSYPATVKVKRVETAGEPVVLSKRRPVPRIETEPEVEPQPEPQPEPEPEPEPEPTILRKRPPPPNIRQSPRRPVPVQKFESPLPSPLAPPRPVPVQPQQPVPQLQHNGDGEDTEVYPTTLHPSIRPYRNGPIQTPPKVKVATKPVVAAPKQRRLPISLQIIIFVIAVTVFYFGFQYLEPSSGKFLVGKFPST